MPHSKRSARTALRRSCATQPTSSSSPERAHEVFYMSQRLYVGNLAFHCSAETLRAAFAEVGDVADVRIISDRETGQSRGFAFVTMASPEAGRNAIASMNGALVEGRPLRVNEAEERGGPGARPAPRARPVEAIGDEPIGNPRPGGHRGW
jgi:RNA recognition motif-containing protein